MNVEIGSKWIGRSRTAWLWLILAVISVATAYDRISKIVHFLGLEHLKPVVLIIYGLFNFILRRQTWGGVGPGRSRPWCVSKTVAFNFVVYVIAVAFVWRAAVHRGNLSTPLIVAFGAAATMYIRMKWTNQKTTWLPHL
jgi:hypothetical protein